MSGARDMVMSSGKLPYLEGNTPPESSEVHANSGTDMLSLLLQTIHVGAVNTNCTTPESTGKASFIYGRGICIALEGQLIMLC